MYLKQVKETIELSSDSSPSPSPSPEANSQVAVRIVDENKPMAPETPVRVFF